MHEDDRKHAFIRGLKPHIQRELAIREPATLREAVEVAERIDSVLYRTAARSAAQPGSSMSGPEPMELGALEWADDGAEDFRSDCDGPELSALQRLPQPSSGRRPQRLRSAPLTRQQRDEHLEKGLCFSCHQPGHRSADCPARTMHPKGVRPPPAALPARGGQ
jgi:hypothetical protein